MVKGCSEKAKCFLKSMLEYNFIPPEGFLLPGEKPLFKAVMHVETIKMMLLNFLLQKVLIQYVICSAKNYDRLK